MQGHGQGFKTVWHDGLGFGDFTDDNPAGEAQNLFPCDEPAEAQDFVFTRDAPFN